MTALFDPKTLSDDELLARSNDIVAKINHVARFGSGTAMEPLQRLLAQVEQERAERFFLAHWSAAKAELEAPIESDPDLAAAARAERAEQEQRQHQHAGSAGPAVKPPGRRPMVTRQPVTPEPPDGIVQRRETPTRSEEPAHE